MKNRAKLNFGVKTCHYDILVSFILTICLIDNFGIKFIFDNV